MIFASPMPLDSSSIKVTLSKVTNASAKAIFGSKHNEAAKLKPKT
jgi:hypothetical protein